MSRLTEEYIEYCTTQVLKFVSKWNDQVTTMTGLYQADTTIADLLSNRKVDVAVGNDCDFSYLCGRHSLQITDFKLGKLKTSRGRKSHSTTNETFLKTDHALSNICLSCSNIEDIDLCSEITRIKYDIPKATPILNDMKDIRCRCLVAVLLGNDTFPPSLKKHTILTGISVTTITEIVQKTKTLQQSTQQEMYDCFLECLFQKIPDKNKKIASCHN